MVPASLKATSLGQLEYDNSPHVEIFCRKSCAGKRVKKNFKPPTYLYDLWIILIIRTRDRSVSCRCRKLRRRPVIFYSVDFAVLRSHFCGFYKIKISPTLRLLTLNGALLSECLSVLRCPVRNFNFDNMI